MPLNLFGRPLNTSPVDPRLLEEANRALFARARLDNAPVGSVGAPSGVRPAGAAVDRRINPLQAAAVASAPIPGLGDALGLAADAQMFMNEPESRTPINFGLSALGLLPFVPPAVASVGAMGYLMNRGGRVSDMARAMPGQAGVIGHHGTPHTLPMDEAARMARAVDQGYVVDAYHGTGADIDEFKGMTWGGTTPDIANQYADMRYKMSGADSSVMPVRMAPGVSFNADALPKTVTTDSFMNELMAQAHKNGVDVDRGAARDLLARIRRGAKVEESGPHYE